MRIAALLALPFLACAGSAEPRSGTQSALATPVTPEAPVTPQAPPIPAFVVHEWGTFTSVMDKTGEPLPGLHIEEEGLPPFVHGRCDSGPVCLTVGDKDLESLPEAVTQKLETPVLFFYSDTPKTVRVTVDFPDGIISQHFPRASAFAPAVGAMDGIRDGAMSWEVQLDPAIPLDTFPWVPADDIWAPSRLVAATPLRVGDEHERFIFYRGLGRFTPPMRITTQGTQATFHNDSADAIAAAFHLRLDPDGSGHWQRLGAIAPRSSTTFETSKPGAPGSSGSDPRSGNAHLDDARADLISALTDSGLRPDEALSMVDTWSHSYFQSTGTRVLYIVPSRWTDSLLPIAIDPPPDELVRTLVGRVEIFSDADESALMDRFASAWNTESAAPGALDATYQQLGRFAAPHLYRLAQVAATRSDVEGLSAWLMARYDEACMARF